MWLFFNTPRGSQHEFATQELFGLLLTYIPALYCGAVEFALGWTVMLESSKQP